MKGRIANLIRNSIKNPSYALQVGKNKIISLTNLDYHLLNGYSFLPSVIRIDLTYRCNLKCKICFEFGENPQQTFKSGKDYENIPFEYLKTVIDEVSFFKPTFYLSGGEPLLYPGIIELLEYLQNKKLYCLINTNGVLLEKYARNLVKLGVDKIIVSIDGPEEVHDLNRGKTFKKIIEGIKIIKDIKKRENRYFPLIRINSLITPFNSEHLEDTVTMAEKLGIDSLTFQHPMFSNEEVRKGYVECVKDDKLNQINILGFTYEGGIDTDSLLRQITNIKSKKIKIPVNFYPDIKINEIKYYYSDLNYKFENKCLSAWRKVIITPEGKIGPCVNHLLDNISHKSFREIWNSSKYVTFRKNLKKNGLFPSCMRCCLREY